MPVAAALFVKVAAASGAAIACTDVLAQLYAHRAHHKNRKERRTSMRRASKSAASPVPPVASVGSAASPVEAGPSTRNGSEIDDSIEEDGATDEEAAIFKVDIMRTMRHAAFGAALSPLVFGGTLLFSVAPTMYPSILAGVGMTEAIYVPLAAWCALNKEMTTGDLTPHITPTIMITAGITVAACYTIGSVVLGHRILFLPLISSLGEIEPESIIFTVGLTTASALYSVFVNAVDVYTPKNSKSSHENHSSATSWGYASCIGLAALAIFPSTPGPGITPIIHYVGAITFLFGNCFLFHHLQENLRGSKDPETRARYEARQKLLIFYGAATIGYPIAWLHYKVLSAVFENVAAFLWLLLLESYHKEISAFDTTPKPGSHVVELIEDDAVEDVTK